MNLTYHTSWEMNNTRPSSLDMLDRLIVEPLEILETLGFPSILNQNFGEAEGVKGVKRFKGNEKGKGDRGGAGDEGKERDKGSRCSLVRSGCALDR